MSKELGNKLKELRSRAGFTQKQIADQLNVDRSTYSNYERAVTEPDIKTLIKLSRVFGVDANQLLSNEEILKVADPGSMPTYSLTKDEKTCVLRFRLLNSEQRQKTLDFMEKYLILDE